MSPENSSPRQSGFAQKFLFVDLSGTGASLHHSQVLSHVRQNYHTWRRKQQIDRLRDFTVVPAAACGKKLLLPSYRRQTTQRPDGDIGAHSSLETSRKGKSRRRQRVCSQTSLLRAHSTQSIISHRGNSDPFNAYPVNIDPQINEMIAFYRDYVLPAQYHAPSKTWVSFPNARLDWSICISTLQHPDLASAFIARAATVAAMLNPSIRALAMRYRLRSIQQLRVRLLNNEDQSWSNLSLLQIIMLQKVEIVEKNLPAAAAHAKVLQHLFQERQRRKETLDFTLLQYALWSDSQISTIFMSPQAFDVEPDGWVAKAMQPAWTTALKELQSIPQWIALRDNAEASLDPCVEGAELRSFFVSRRTTLQTWLLFGLEGLPVSTLILLWLATTTSVQQGRMIKHYLHAVNQVNNTCRSQEEGNKGASGQEYWYTQQYLILAEFIWTHHLSYKVEVCGVDLFDVVPTLLKDLRTALESDIWSSKYENARLWALFIGAHTERLASKVKQPGKAAKSNKQDSHYGSQQPDKDHGSEKYWFRTRLALQVRRMALTTWVDVFNVLKGFNYADVVQPLGKDLLDEVMHR